MGTLGEQKPSQPAGSWVSAEALHVAHVSRGTLVPSTRVTHLWPGFWFCRVSCLDEHRVSLHVL